MTESGICHRRLAATSLPSASIATLGARGVFSHLPAAFLPAEPTEARKLPNKANCHIRQIISMTYKVSVLRRGPAAGTEQSRARQGAGPRHARTGLIRAGRAWARANSRTDSRRPKAWARGLPPAALCGYVRQAHCGRRTVGTTTFAANHPTERASGENRTEPCPSGRGPFPMAFFGRGSGRRKKITKQSQLLMFAKYSVGAQRAAPALARHLLCPKTTLYSAGINSI